MAAKAAKYAAGYVAGGIAAKIQGMFGDSKSKEGVSSAITQQNDSMLIYKRRRAPRRIRKRAARRYKNFLKMQLKRAADNSNLFRFNSTALSSSAGGQQTSTITAGYMNAGSAVSDQVGSVWQAWQNYLASNPESTAKKIYITGLDMDYTFNNIDGESDTCEMDVYEYVFRRDLRNYDGGNGVGSLLVQSLADEEKLPGATNKIGVTTLGYTPFDSNEALRYIVIKSKQRYYIGAGQAVSFHRTIKFKRPISIISEDLEETASDTDNWSAKRGLTRGLIVTVKGLPNGANAAAAVTLAYNCQVKYRFKVLDTNAIKNADGT